MAPLVIEWVRLNRDSLRRFWSEGQFWTIDEVNAFADTLQRVSGS